MASLDDSELIVNVNYDDGTGPPAELPSSLYRIITLAPYSQERAMRNSNAPGTDDWEWQSNTERGLFKADELPERLVLLRAKYEDDAATGPVHFLVEDVLTNVRSRVCPTAALDWGEEPPARHPV